LAQIDQPLIIDIEASGFAADSYPIEVGLALKEDQRYCSLIIPAPDWNHWCMEAQQYHHIDRQTLAAYGKAIVDVAAELNHLLAEQTVYSDGWVVDKPWLIKLFHWARLEPSFRISPLEMILSEDQMDIWHQVKDQVIEDLAINRHRASNDALIIQQTYQRTRKMTAG